MISYPVLEKQLRLADKNGKSVLEGRKNHILSGKASVVSVTSQSDPIPDPLIRYASAINRQAKPWRVQLGPEGKNTVPITLYILTDADTMGMILQENDTVEYEIQMLVSPFRFKNSWYILGINQESSLTVAQP